MANIIITEFMDAAQVERLKAHHHVNWNDRLFEKPEALKAAITKAQALIVRNATEVRKDLLDAAPDLKVIGRLGVGLDNIDLDLCRQREIQVCPATGANAPSVAEYVIAVAFQLVRKAFSSNTEMLDGQWPRSALSNGGELAGRTLGLLGLGTIGREVAKRALPLGLKVAAYDPMLPSSGFPADIIRLDMADLLKSADILSLHLPLTAGTRSLLNSETLRTMKKGAIFINTARGGIVDELPLAELLKQGHLGGAALDVFSTEPPDRKILDEFQDIDNVILTPHIAGLTEEANLRVSELTVDNVLKALKNGNC